MNKNFVSRHKQRSQYDTFRNIADILLIQSNDQFESAGVAVWLHQSEMWLYTYSLHGICIQRWPRATQQPKDKQLRLSGNPIYEHVSLPVIRFLIS